MEEFDSAHWNKPTTCDYLGAVSSSELFTGSGACTRKSAKEDTDCTEIHSMEFSDRGASLSWLLRHITSASVDAFSPGIVSNDEVLSIETYPFATFSFPSDVRPKTLLAEEVVEQSVRTVSECSGEYCPHDDSEGVIKFETREAGGGMMEGQSFEYVVVLVWGRCGVRGRRDGDAQPGSDKWEEDF
ncbi:unnamed protein product [Schistocephalus solidus]|uniref:Uncharacterized protein n=1 Tax=Schistocephalus solidus TaxID=70667 RepID=A0A183TJG0_SCHSO|nr:unnamed protein product [Schistocephalus solidus]